MRLFFAFFVSVNKKDKFSFFISTYGTVMKRGVLYYRIRIKDANGKLVAIYAKTPEELYDKETLALEQINLYLYNYSSNFPHFIGFPACPLVK